MNKVVNLILCSLIVGSCTQKSHLEASNSNNTLSVDVMAEIPTYDPQLAEDWNSYRVVNDLFAGLVDFDQANRPVSGLAESWVISLDGKTYTFYLKPNLKFSDGSPIKASDFVYSWRRLVDPNTGSSYAFLLKDVVNAKKIIQADLPAKDLGVRAINSRTFEVKLEHPTNSFLAYLTTPNVFVVKPEVIGKYGESWINPEHLVTSGAYKVIEHVMNGYILATKNPYFYQESQVKIQYVKYLPFVDVNTSIANYKTHSLDLTGQTVPSDQYLNLKAQFNKELHTFKWERMDFINFNMALPKYKNNRKLREALTLAVDRDELTDKILTAGQEPLYSVVTPTIENGKYKDIVYSWSRLPREKRLARASKLYSEAGYSVKHPLEVTIKYQTNELTRRVMASIASMWQENLGVKVNILNEELKMITRDWKNANFDLSQGRWGADYNSVTTYTPIFMCDNGNNRAHYCNPQYDKLIHQAEITLDPKKQELLYKKALKIVLNDYPIIPLYEPTHQRLVNPRVQGYDIQSNYLDNVQTKWMSLQ